MTDNTSITGTINIVLKPFSVPNYAVRAGEGDEASGFKLCDLNVGSLDAMAKAWLDALYQKAGHKSPWVAQRQRASS